MAHDTAPLGFIGIGLMGGAMAEQLLATGHRLVVWNLEPENLARVLGKGAVAAENPHSVAAQCDIVLVCVLDTAAVQSAVFGPNGVAQAASVGEILVDHSTRDPVATRRMAQRLRQETGMGWVDAPVSGGPAFARERYHRDPAGHAGVRSQLHAHGSSGSGSDHEGDQPTDLWCKLCAYGCAYG